MNNEAVHVDSDEDLEQGGFTIVDAAGAAAERSRKNLPVQYFSMPIVSQDASTVSDPLTTYLAQLRHVAPLSAEVQQELAIMYVEDGDVEAAKQLVMSNLRLVVKIAREYHRRRVSLMELVQEGNVGLAEAIRRYDPYRGVKFTSYAQYWIRAMILNYLMNVMQLVKVGSTRSGRRLFYNLKKAREELVSRGIATPSAEQIAEHLGVKEQEVIDVSRIIDAPALSLDSPAPGYDATPLGSILPDPNGVNPDDLAASRQLQVRIRGCLDKFRELITNERELAIWDERITADEGMSLQELGDTFNVSRERIRQVEKGLKDRFKKHWIESIGEEEASLIFED